MTGYTVNGNEPKMCKINSETHQPKIIKTDSPKTEIVC